MKFYQLVDGPPINSASVFHDYLHHDQWMSNVSKIELVGKPDSATTDVKYVVTVFGVSEIYTNRFVVNKSADDSSSYSIAWTMVKVGAHTASSVGEVIFEPFPFSEPRFAGKSLLTYTEKTVPRGLFTAKFFSQVKEDEMQLHTVTNLAKYISVVVNTPGVVMDELVCSLMEALGHTDITTSGDISTCKN